MQSSPAFQKHPALGVTVFHGGTCEFGEMFILRGDKLIYIPGAKWPEVKLELKPEPTFGSQRLPCHLIYYGDFTA